MRHSTTALFAMVITLAAAAPTFGQLIHEDLKLLPSDGTVNDGFSYSIAIDNSIIAVGVTMDDDNGSQSGSAYLFDASSGDQLFKLLPSDGAVDDQFGNAIAIDNGVVAVGATWDDDNGNQSGSAYLFDVSSGDQLFKLLPSDGTESDYFGHSIAIDNGIVAVGAAWDDDNGSNSGSAYLFDASSGEQLFRLLASDGAEYDYFGYSIAIDNGIVAIGARGDDDNGSTSGSAYLFDASTGAQIAKLIARDGAADDWFGYSIAISNGIVAVGAHNDDDNGLQSGSAYLFNASTDRQIAKFIASDGAADDWFGYSISISNGIVAVGARNDDDNGLQSGSAYLFDASTEKQIAKLLPSDGAKRDSFGFSIAVDDGIAAVGAVGDDDNGDGSGSAYAFDVLSIPSCLDLVVENLIAGQEATFTVSNGTVGAKAVTVYGLKPGHVRINGFADDRATFGIEHVNQSKIIGGLNRTFDDNGEIIIQMKIHANFSGLHVLFQSAQHGTCPNECMSNLVEMVVE